MDKDYPVSEPLLLQLDRSALAEHRLLGRFTINLPELEVPEVSPEVRLAAMHAWEDRARSEYIGVMVMRRFHGLLIDLNAPLDLQEVALEMMLHEQRHTSLCMHAAQALGSESEVSFDMEELQQSRGDVSPDELVLEMLCGTFATGEVVAQSLILHSIKSLPSSGFREILRAIAKDEVLHSSFGGIVLGALKSDDSWLTYPGDDWVSACVNRHIQTMQARDVVEPSEAERFEEPAQADQMKILGIPPSSAFKDHYLAALDTEVIAGFQTVGITIDRSTI